jgi:hypothetical protein
MLIEKVEYLVCHYHIHFNKKYIQNKKIPINQFMGIFYLRIFINAKNEHPIAIYT